MSMVCEPWGLTMTVYAPKGLTTAPSLLLKRFHPAFLECQVAGIKATSATSACMTFAPIPSPPPLSSLGTVTAIFGATEQVRGASKVSGAGLGEIMIFDIQRGALTIK